MSLTITEAKGIPTVTRGSKEPNPFADHFPTDPGNPDKGVQPSVLVVELPSDTDDEKKAIEKVVSQARAAALGTVNESHPKGYTARVHREGFEKGTGKAAKQFTRLTIWTVDRIERPRNATEQATEGSES